MTGVCRPMQVNEMGKCGYGYMSRKPYPWALKQAQNHIFWTRTEADTADLIRSAVSPSVLAQKTCFWACFKAHMYGFQDPYPYPHLPVSFTHMGLHTPVIHYWPWGWWCSSRLVAIGKRLREYHRLPWVFQDNPHPYPLVPLPVNPFTTWLACIGPWT